MTSATPQERAARIAAAAKERERLARLEVAQRVQLEAPEVYEFAMACRRAFTTASRPGRLVWVRSSSGWVWGARCDGTYVEASSSPAAGGKA